MFSRKKKEKKREIKKINFSSTKWNEPVEKSNFDYRRSPAAEWKTFAGFAPLETPISIFAATIEIIRLHIMLISAEREWNPLRRRIKYDSLGCLAVQFYRYTYLRSAGEFRNIVTNEKTVSPRGNKRSKKYRRCIRLQIARKMEGKTNFLKYCSKREVSIT